MVRINATVLLCILLVAKDVLLVLLADASTTASRLSLMQLLLTLWACRVTTRLMTVLSLLTVRTLWCCRVAGIWDRGEVNGLTFWVKFLRIAPSVRVTLRVLVCRPRLKTACLTMLRASLDTVRVILTMALLD